MSASRANARIRYEKSESFGALSCAVTHSGSDRFKLINSWVTKSASRCSKLNEALSQPLIGIILLLNNNLPPDPISNEFCKTVSRLSHGISHWPASNRLDNEFLFSQFLGVWYAIQKTSTASECVIYNISQVEPGQYLIQQLSQDYLIGLAPVSHRYSYTGELEVKDNDVPAKMTVKFPLNVLPGDAIFKIFMTDYGKHKWTVKDRKCLL